MKKFWKWLDGKKTILGVLSSAIVVFLVAQGWINGATATLIGTITGSLFAVGVGHKISKYNK